MIYINAIIIVILIELVFRIFLASVLNISFLATYNIPQSGFYNINHLPSTEEADLSVLLLGGSVLYKDYGSVESILQHTLEDQLHKKVLVTNLSYPAHVSRDSYEKYSMLKSKHYDYIIIYHGINETRMNNCPREVFKNDYSHSKWFTFLNIIKSHKERSITVIPMTIHLLIEQYNQRNGKSLKIPIHQPAEHWLREGGSIKNEKSIEHYYRAIIDMAIQNGSNVLLFDFAYYIPDNYSEEAFLNHELDYDQHINPISIWGLPDNVKIGIEKHNAIVTKLAYLYKLKMGSPNTRIPKNTLYFNDICHLTDEGCYILALVFAEKIIDEERCRIPGGE